MSSAERTRRARRARPVIALAIVAFLIGAIVGAAHHGSAGKRLAEQFAQAWTRGDYASMYGDIDQASQQAISLGSFTSAYRAAARTATTTRVSIAGKVLTSPDGTIAIPLRVRTRLFGTLREQVRIVLHSESGATRVAWSRALVFPGLRTGERLSRHTTLPARASLLARDGSVLAEGAAEGAGTRESPLGVAADAVIGEVGPIPASRAATLEAQGVPSDAIVGTSGLELALDERLRGTPGGDLLAGSRVLASVAAKPSQPVRTTISPAIQQAAATALGDQYGGVVAMDPRNGQILAVAGIGTDSLQPPGSTFKMVTVTAALEAKVAKASSTFPYATSATLDGVKLENANGESCGGSLTLAFAVSCNSVFAPLGVKIGSKRLVETAEGFGFNHPSPVPGAAESTLPPAAQIQGELDIGSTAIGQGEVQASPLQMMRIAATIGDGGRRPTPTFQFATTTSALGSDPRVMDPSTARLVRRMMIDVVREGTGTSAAIPGVTVAGKTGTAELGAPHCEGSQGESSNSSEETAGQEEETGCSGAKDPQNTDAWFAAFAPALHPRIAIGVLLVKDGAGGDTAAPVARQVIEQALR